MFVTKKKLNLIFGMGGTARKPPPGANAGVCVECGDALTAHLQFAQSFSESVGLMLR
jgi:hypothetical protein